jgi:hypothetical protein
VRRSIASRRGVRRGTALQAIFDLPPELARLLCCAPRPDADGFPGIEIALAHLGLSLRRKRGESRRSASRPLARRAVTAFTRRRSCSARATSARHDHLRRRAAYAGGTGTLIVADAHGEARVLDLERGALVVRDTELLPVQAASPMVEIDTAARRLVWSGEARLEAVSG